MKAIVYTGGNWSRQWAARQQGVVFLFGDNTEDRVITKYVPSSTQACIRGLHNAIGIDTKKNRREEPGSYFYDEDFDAFKQHVDEAIAAAIETGKIIVLPAGGIGTGKARLQQTSPKCFAYLQNKLQELFGRLP